MRPLLRLLRAAWVLLRHDAAAFLRDSPAPPPRAVSLLLRLLARRKRHEPDTHPLSDALQKLGPSYIKLGQFLATRPDIIGESLADELAILQDRLPPFSQEQAHAAIQREFGAPADQLFAEFGEPVAAASIAQVHRATLSDGRAVAVKILRPGIEARFERDLRDFAFTANLIETLFPAARRLRPRQTVAMLEASVRQEMDLRLEAAALSEMAQHHKADADFHTPKPDWRLVSQRILATEWVDGTPLSDLPAVRATGTDLPALATRLIRIFLRQAMLHGFFHADMHPGNLFLQEDGSITAVDFGIVSRLNADERLFLAGVLHGFLERDYLRIAELHFRLNYVPPTRDVEDFALALRAIGEPITDKDARDISMSRLLLQLFQVTAQFDMPTQPRLLLLQKTMVVVEGLARRLDPEHNMWESARPVAQRWMAENLSLPGRARHGGAELLEGAGAFRRLPAMLEDAAEGLRWHVRREREAAVRRERERRFASRLWRSLPVLALLAVAFTLGWLLGK